MNSADKSKLRSYYDLGPWLGTDGRTPGRLLQIKDGNATCTFVTARRFDELKQAGAILSSSIKSIKGESR